MNGFDAPDYDESGFYSRNPIRRYWHRRRHKIIVGWAEKCNRILDAGCGSSMIIQSLPGARGLDTNIRKTRYLNDKGIDARVGSIFALPFDDATFDCVISSEVIEHVKYSPTIFTEMHRVLRPSGTLIIGTPDYGTWGWRIIEPLYGLLLPNGYKDDHITHYNRKLLTWLLGKFGFEVKEVKYVCRSELIMLCQKT